MNIAHSRVSIIGCGHVGTACAFGLLQSRLVREIVLIDEEKERAQGEALDLQQAAPLGMPVVIFAGTYKDAAASSIVVLTAGGPGGLSGSRLDQLAGNVVILRDCLSQLRAEGFNGVLLIATNPVDVLTYVAQMESGLPVGQIVGSGTLIDTQRLRLILAEKLGVEARSVNVSVIGEHGDSSVAVWSSAQVAGMPLAHWPLPLEFPSQVELLATARRAGPEVVALKGNTCFAIAACVTRICEAILRDERSVLLVSALMTGQYGLRDVSFSTPCIVGRAGVEHAFAFNLDLAELEDLLVSAKILRHARAQLTQRQ